MRKKIITGAALRKNTSALIFFKSHPFGRIYSCHLPRAINKRKSMSQADCSSFVLASNADYVFSAKKNLNKRPLS